MRGCVLSLSSFRKMSRVEGYFVLSKHVDVLGTCKGPGDTVLVTLEKGGVIQYNTSTQV